MHAPQQCKNKKMTRVEGYCIYIVLFFPFFLPPFSLYIITCSHTFSLLFICRRHLRDFFISSLFFQVFTCRKNWDDYMYLQMTSTTYFLLTIFHHMPFFSLIFTDCISMKLIEKNITWKKEKTDRNRIPTSIMNHWF